MSKFVTIATVCALLSVTAMADVQVTIPDGFEGVFQTQANANGIVNAVNLQHGTYAENIVALTVNDQQEISDVHHIGATQGLKADLWQSAITGADSGVLAVAQELGTAGAQWQLIGDSVAPKAQGQTQALEGQQTVTKTGGQANAMVMQTGLNNQNQSATNSAGTMNESVGVTSFQFSNVAGAPGTVAAVGSAVSTTTTQSQVVY